MLKNLLREPLLHFLLIGAALFLVYSLQNDDVPDDGSNRIVITEAHIDRLIAMWEKQHQRLPTPEELDGLIEHQIREEVLYREALAMGLINRVVPDAELRQAARDWALHIAKRSPVALAAIKHSFSARTTGVNGLGRIAHDLLLREYLDTEEAKEMSASFGEKRDPDASKFGR